MNVLGTKSKRKILIDLFDISFVELYLPIYQQCNNNLILFLLGYIFVGCMISYQAGLMIIGFLWLKKVY